MRLDLWESSGRLDLASKEIVQKVSFLDLGSPALAHANADWFHTVSVPPVGGAGDAIFVRHWATHTPLGESSLAQTGDQRTQQTAGISARRARTDNGCGCLAFVFRLARLCKLFDPGYDIARSLNEEEQLLPEILKDMGYQTHMVGKWHLGQHERKFTPLGRGFDTYCGNLGGAADHFHHNCEILRENTLDGFVRRNRHYYITVKSPSETALLVIICEC